MDYTRRVGILMCVLGAACSCSRAAPAGPDGSAPEPPPVDGTHSLRELLAASARVRVRELTPTAPAIRPAIHEVVLADPAEVAEVMTAIGPEQRPDPDRCPTCVPALTLVFEDAAGKRQGALGVPCGAEAERPAPATFATPASSRCAAVTVVDLAALRAIVARHEEKD